MTMCNIIYFLKVKCVTKQCFKWRFAVLQRCLFSRCEKNTFDWQRRGEMPHITMILHIFWWQWKSFSKILSFITFMISDTIFVQMSQYHYLMSSTAKKNNKKKGACNLLDCLLCCIMGSVGTSCWKFPIALIMASLQTNDEKWQNRTGDINFILGSKLVPTLPTMQLSRWLLLDAMYQITCSFHWSHKML